MQVEAFILEGIKENGREKRTLTLPSATKKTRTQVMKQSRAVGIRRRESEGHVCPSQEYQSVSSCRL